MARTWFLPLDPQPDHRVQRHIPGRLPPSVMRHLFWGSTLVQDVSRCHYNSVVRRLLPLWQQHSLSHALPSCRRRFSGPRTLSQSQRRNDNFSTGYTSEYSISPQGNGRGPIYDRKEPSPLFPRDIKDRVDAYVVGQEKAKVRSCCVQSKHCGAWPCADDGMWPPEGHQYRLIQPHKALHKSRTSRRRAKIARCTPRTPHSFRLCRAVATKDCGGSSDTRYLITIPRVQCVSLGVNNLVNRPQRLPTDRL